MEKGNLRGKRIEKKRGYIPERNIYKPKWKTGTNKISAVFPEKGNFNFKILLKKIMQVNISNSYIIRRTKYLK